MSEEAIRAIGYTDDGMVGMLIHIEVEGKKYAANIAMKPDYTDNLATSLVEAAKQARGKVNERNSANPNKSVPKSD